METALLDSVNAALGVLRVHHSAQQPGGDAAHEVRRLATLSAALHFTNWRGANAGGATPLSTLPLLIWGSPPRSSVLVRVVLLPFGEVSPAALHTYMPPYASLQDLAAQLQRLSGISPLRFRMDSPDSVPLHSTRLLSAILAFDSDGGGGGGSCLQLFASAIAAQPSPAGDGPPVSLTLDRELLSDLDGRAPLHSLLRPPADNAYFVQNLGPEEEPMAVDDTRPLADFDGASLATQYTAGAVIALLVTVSCPAADAAGEAREVPLPEAWALADLLAWSGHVPGGPHTLLVDGAPPPAGFSHASVFDAVELLVRAPVGALLNAVAKTQMGKTVRLRFSVMDTVLQLMCAIQDVEGIPPQQQRLIFAGRQMEASHMLCQYGMTEGSELHLMLRLTGC